MRNKIRIIIGLMLCVGFPLLAQQQVGTDKEQVKWETLEGCKLITDAVVDGDSFHVQYNERQYIFRLYFVDAPESDPALKERIKDQSAYFGVAANDIPRVGKIAAKFTRDKLTATNFTVITRWQNAMGRSSLARFYAIVLIDNENLAEELVSGGLARIYGLRANWPDGPRSTTFINKLKNLELNAREKKLGVWNESAFPRETGASAAMATAPASAITTNPLVDVNTATAEELDSLPGIGPVLADRIIAGRPYTTIEELDKVSGIGKATIEKLRPFVQVKAKDAAPQ